MPINKIEAALDDIRQQAKPQIASQMNSLYTEVRDILDSDQQRIDQRYGVAIVVLFNSNR